jgi:17beta-estradiol 17-dehydrogenase / very-long-chain 3-oxoacyl-CoA reductase
VNNAEEFDPFGPKIHRAKDEDVLGTLTINTFPMIFMSRFLGPDLKLRAEQTKQKGAIINMTSYYSTFNVQNAPLYSSTKAFEDVFSQILGYENADLDVLTVKNMPCKSKQHPNGVETKEVVEGVLADLGHERISYGHWKHALFRYYYLWRQCQWWQGRTNFRNW